MGRLRREGEELPGEGVPSDDGGGGAGINYSQAGGLGAWHSPPGAPSTPAPRDMKYSYRPTVVRGAGWSGEGPV